MAISLPLLGTSGSTTSECKDNWICVDEIRQDKAIQLRARNLQDYPVTYTLQVQTNSYAVNGPKTVTRTLRPRQTQAVMTLVPRDGYRRNEYGFSLDWTVGDKNANHDDDHLYAFPYKAGKSFRILQGFGSRFSHRGLEEYAIDFGMPIGTPVHAARAGVVARLEESNSIGCWEDGCGKYANFVIILHSDGTTGEYYHLKENGAFVDVGDSVARGERIGLSGNTGHTTMPHLHFAVYRASTWGRTQSIPVRFQSADGVISRPRRGGRHQASY